MFCRSHSQKKKKFIINNGFPCRQHKQQQQQHSLRPRKTKKKRERKSYLVFVATAILNTFLFTTMSALADARNFLTLTSSWNAFFAMFITSSPYSPLFDIPWSKDSTGKTPILKAISSSLPKLKGYELSEIDTYFN
jgi:hypothetical protein